MSAFKRKIKDKFYFAALDLLSREHMNKEVPLSAVAKVYKQPEWPSAGEL